MNILVVDDDTIVNRVIQFFLKGFPHSIDVANTGTKAISLYRKNNYDLIFMDLGLPDLNGIEVTKQIRKLSARDKFVPIIALTGYCDEICKQACFTAGMNNFLNKPLQYEQLQKILNNYTNTTPYLFLTP